MLRLIPCLKTESCLPRSVIAPQTLLSKIPNRYRKFCQALGQVSVNRQPGRWFSGPGPHNLCLFNSACPVSSLTDFHLLLYMFCQIYGSHPSVRILQHYDIAMIVCVSKPEIQSWHETRFQCTMSGVALLLLSVASCGYETTIARNSHKTI